MSKNKLKKLFFPRTKFGKYSLILIILFFLFFMFMNFLILLGQRGGKNFFSNLRLSIPGLLAGVFGICSFFTGIISIIKSKERAILVFISTLIGLFILFFVAGEVIFPH